MHIDLYSNLNTYYLICEEQIITVFNNHSNCMDADSNRMMRMRIAKSNNHILQKRILLITASVFSPLVAIKQ